MTSPSPAQLDRFARWTADEAAGIPSPALCRRCGLILRFRDRPCQQIHDWCATGSGVTA